MIVCSTDPTCPCCRTMRITIFNYRWATGAPWESSYNFLTWIFWALRLQNLSHNHVSPHNRVSPHVHNDTQCFCIFLTNSRGLCSRLWHCRAQLACSINRLKHAPMTAFGSFHQRPRAVLAFVALSGIARMLPSLTQLNFTLWGWCALNHIRCRIGWINYVQWICKRGARQTLWQTKIWEKTVHATYYIMITKWKLPTAFSLSVCYRSVFATRDRFTGFSSEV